VILLENLFNPVGTSGLGPVLPFSRTSAIAVTLTLRHRDLETPTRPQGAFSVADIFDVLFESAGLFPNSADCFRIVSFLNSMKTDYYSRICKFGDFSIQSHFCVLPKTFYIF